MQPTTRNLALLALALACAGCGGSTDEGTDPGASTIVYVDPGALGLGDGTSWADAYPMLTTALLNAPAGAQVWIKEGVYKRTTGADRTLSFDVDRKLALYGGFAGTETATDQRDLTSFRTVLSGDIGIAVTTTDNTHKVLAINAADVTLDGLEIADATGIAGKRGAGIDVAVGATGLVLRSVVVRGCANADTTSFGAGLVLGGSVGATIRDCVFAANAVSDGDGGGLWLGSGCSANLVNCLFVNNTASDSGAAIQANNSHLSLLNTTVYNCDNANNGPVHAPSTAVLKTLTVRNCLFDQNSSSPANGSVTGGPLVTYTITYNRLDGTNALTTPLANGNITSAVAYEGAGVPAGTDGFYGTDDDGLRQKAPSTGIGAGDPVGAPNRDVSGEPRNALIDMGAYDQIGGGG